MKRFLGKLVLFFLIIVSYFYLTIRTEADHKWEFGISMRDHVTYIRVTKVRANSVAEKAGIEVGNDIIGFNNYKITNINEFKSVFNQTYQHHKHKINIRKYGNYLGGSISLIVNIDLNKKQFKKKKDEIYSSLSRCKTVLHNCYSEVKFSDGKYYGDWKNDKPHGDGKFIFKEDDLIHIGEFANGQLHGKGTMKSKNDEIMYTGEFRNGYAHGYGIKFFSKDGKENYKGNWKKDSRSGKGTYTWADGGKYEGNWKNNEPDGFGKMIYVIPEGKTQYNGNWANGIKKGFGKFIDYDGKVISGTWDEYFLHGYNEHQNKYTWENGNYYKGRFNNELPNGKGIIKSKDDVELYSGDVKDGKKHGQGIKTFSNGKKQVGIWKNNKFVCCYDKGIYFFKKYHFYTGEFKNYKPYGRGKITYPNGDTYVGFVISGLDQSGNKVNGNRHGQGTMTFPDERKYVGEWKNNKLNGQGTMTFPDGRKYVGEWKNNKLNGQGTMTFPDGRKYVGEWKDNQINGYGTYYYDNGEKYVGEFIPADVILNLVGIFEKKNGKGTYYYANGNIYDGDWKNDQKYGYGTYLWKNGDKYEGKFKNDSREGKGIFTYANGDKYEGDFFNEKRDGQGVFNYANDDRYEGKWKDNQINGYGVFVWANGNKYEGEWKEGLVNGYGAYTYLNGEMKEVLTYDNGDVYKGNFLNNLPHGKGVIYSSLGNRKFIGEFKSGKKNGFGSIVSKNNGSELKKVSEWKNNKPLTEYFSTLLEPCQTNQTQSWNNCYGKAVYKVDDKNIHDFFVGFWKNGLKSGQGSYTWADGDKYEGEWKDDKKHGHGTKTWTSGSKYVGEWKDDKEHGQGIFTYAEGDKYEGEVKDGNKHGQGTYTWTDGDKYEGEWKDDQINGFGQVIATYADGDKYEGNVKDNKKHGQGTYFFSNGSYQKGEWRNDKIVKGDFFTNYVYKNAFIQILSNEVKLIEDNELVTTIPSNSEINFNNILGISKDYLIISYNNKKGNMERNPDDIFEKINIQDSYVPYAKNIGQMVKIYNEILDTTKLVEKYENSDWYDVSDQLKLRNAKKLLPTLELNLKNERQIILTEIEKEKKREEERKRLAKEKEEERKRLAKEKEEERKRIERAKKLQEENKKQALEGECYWKKREINDTRKLVRKFQTQYIYDIYFRYVKEYEDMGCGKWRH